MSLRQVMRSGLVALTMAGIAVGLSSDAFASHIDWEARRAEREAEREAKRAARDAEEEGCTCSAGLKFSSPSLFFSGGTLKFTPQVDVDIRARGGNEAPPLNVGVAFEGETSYSSEDVGVPAGVSFGGNKSVMSGLPCNGNYHFRGLELTEVPLPGLIPSLLGDKEELDGKVRMKASIQGCGFDEEERQFSFRMREFGNLRINGWRSVRH